MPRTILVVDDSRTMLQTITLVLEKEGNKIVTASDGTEALNILNGNTSVNLIITDVNMPNMDGITLTREIKKIARRRFAPIIILTTESHRAKKDEGKAAGATGWIVKPFRPDTAVPN